MKFVALRSYILVIGRAKCPSQISTTKDVLPQDGEIVNIISPLTCFSASVHYLQDSYRILNSRLQTSSP